MSETRIDSRGAGEDDREVRRLEAEIASKRERVSTSFDELRERVHQATSMRHWAAAHPVAWLGVGVFLGVLLGYGVRRNRRPET
jgi:F0F1-type ATP synthase assembly protein I